jgi:hypothetical protein
MSEVYMKGTQRLFQSDSIWMAELLGVFYRKQRAIRQTCGKTCMGGPR